MDVSVKLSRRELQLLVGVLEVDVKEMEDKFGIGITDPDREPDLQELRDLHEKLSEALIEAGRQAPRCPIAAHTSRNRLMEESANRQCTPPDLQGERPLDATPHHSAPNRWRSLGD